MKIHILLFALLAVVGAEPTSSKIGFKLQQSLKSKSYVNIMVSFESPRAVLLKSLPTLESVANKKNSIVYEALKAHALKTQATALQVLQSSILFSTNVESFWITNQISVQKANVQTIQSLAALDDVIKIEEELVIKLDDVEKTSDRTISKSGNEWNIEKIQAPQAWSLAGNGTGVVIGIIDTGARHTHESISGNYRAGTHSWYDPVRRTNIPGDGNGHGTHITGTAVGIHGIGVAPGAKWIACKGFTDSGLGFQRALIGCGQFILCPHEYNTENPDCTLAPHIVSNSWGSPIAGTTFFDDVLTAWHAAGIIPVFAAGNSGPECGTMLHPADSRIASIAVGATARNDSIASFSSRGPAAQGPGTNPDISAPGVEILSAAHGSDSGFIAFSGTSCACPHVSGLVALLKEIDVHADFNTISSILTSTTDQDLTFGNSECEGISESVFPNYVFGFGRINALKAVEAMQARIKV